MFVDKVLDRIVLIWPIFSVGGGMFESINSSSKCSFISSSLSAHTKQSSNKWKHDFVNNEGD